jgi:hypothetical protein
MLSRCFCVQDDEDSDDQGIIMRESFPTNSEPTTTDDSSTFFRDGRRKIDFVLVYEENSRRSTLQDTSGDRKTNKLDMWRQRFMANLRREGLDMEEVGRKFMLMAWLVTFWKSQTEIRIRSR